MMIIMMMMMTMLKAAGRSVGDSEECLDCEAQGCAGREAGPSDNDHVKDGHHGERESMLKELN